VPADAIAFLLRRVGRVAQRTMGRVGYSARFFMLVLYHSPAAFRRMQLTLREIYFSGVLSLVIILVSGLFVGMVLGLQGYDTLNKYGAGDSLGIFVGLSLVRELGPDFVFLENVYGLKNVPGYSAFRRLLNTLEELGYKTESGMVDASDFGVPQTRRRFVLTAVRFGNAVWPTRTHGPRLKPYVTVRKAIEKFPELRHGEKHPRLPNHIASPLSDLNFRRITATPQDGGSRSQWPDDLKLACHAEHDGHPDVYGRLRWDAPAPTLTTKCTSLSNGRYGHPEQNRAISAREAAALQGFKTKYVFFATVHVLRRLIGNAVPPPVAKHFGLEFVRRAKKKRTYVPKWQALWQNSKVLVMKKRKSRVPKREPRIPMRRAS